MLLWTIIVLALAIHFHGILTTNDLSECFVLGPSVGGMWDVTLTPPLARFIPFAIFVSAATVILLLALSVLFHITLSLRQGFSTRFSGCFSVLGEPTPFRQELNLGALALMVSSGSVRSPPRSDYLGFTLWLTAWFLSVLAAFLVTSDAEEADVECFTSDAASNQVPIEMPGCKSHCASFIAFTC